MYPGSTEPAWPRAPRAGSGQVVDGRAAHRGGGVVRGDPRGDLLRGRAPASRAAHAAGDEVVDPVLAHVLPELGQRRRRVAAVEAADREHRRPGRQLVPGGVVRADGRGHPPVPAAVGGEQRDQLGTRRGRGEQAAHAAGPTGHRAATGRGTAGDRTGAGRRDADPERATHPRSARAAEAGTRDHRTRARNRSIMDGRGGVQRVAGGTGEDGREHQVGAEPAGPPQQGGTDAGERADRRGQGHGVVRVEDALHEAERGGRDQQPPAPQHQRGPGPVDPGRAAAQPESGGQQDQRGRQQPRHLTADLGGEEPAPARSAPAVHPADAAGLLAGEPAEPVVPQGQLQDAVVLRAADVGAGRGRPQRDDGHPPPGGADHRQRGEGELPEPATHRGGRGDEVDQTEPGQHQHRLQHLGEEADPDQGAGQDEPPGRGPFQRPRDGVGRRNEEQHQQRVRVVEPEHQHRDRGDREHRTGEQACDRSEPAPYRGVEQPDRGDPGEGLGHQDAPRVEPEQPHRQPNDPQRGGSLVDGDRVAGVERAEEPRLPARRSGLGRGRVVPVGPPGGAQPPQIEQCGTEQERRHGGAYPARAGGPHRARGRRAGRRGQGFHVRGHGHAPTFGRSRVPGLWSGCAPAENRSTFAPEPTHSGHTASARSVGSARSGTSSRRETRCPRGTRDFAARPPSPSESRRPVRSARPRWPRSPGPTRRPLAPPRARPRAPAPMRPPAPTEPPGWTALRRCRRGPGPGTPRPAGRECHAVGRDPAAALRYGAVAAWGSTARLVVTEPARLAAASRLVTTYLSAVDRACSRFRGDSEIRVVQRAQGQPVRVSALLADLVAAALAVARRTDGRVDPTLGGAMVRLGYDRDLQSLTSTGGRWRQRAEPAPDWRRVELSGRELTVPPGVLLDLGATGKAFAADRCAELVAGSCDTGVLVSLGGDLATAGPTPDGGWQVVVQDRSDEPRCVVALPGGTALATSSTRSRRWRAGGHLLHHILDPRTCQPAKPVWRTVSVAAYDCVEANALSTAAIVHGSGADDWLRIQHRPARLVDASGTVHTVGGVARLSDAAWYLARGTGVASLVLLTIVVALGIATRSGRPAFGLPRFAVTGVHRNASLLSVLLLAIHVGTLLVDPYAHLKLVDVVLPFAFLHALGTGTDAGEAWLRGTAAVCAATVLAAVGWRCSAGYSRLSTVDGVR